MLNCNKKQNIYRVISWNGTFGHFSLGSTNLKLKHISAKQVWISDQIFYGYCSGQPKQTEFYYDAHVPVLIKIRISGLWVASSSNWYS